MVYNILAFLLLGTASVLNGANGASEDRGKAGSQEALGSGIDGERYRTACPDYKHYAIVPHRPLSKGPLALPFQRPSPHCRTFSSPLVEEIIDNFSSRMKDKDLARIFENAFPNTLDTTVRWHVDRTQKHSKHTHYQNGQWEGAQSFIVTGDIHAEWLRDSTNQLAQYQPLAKKDKRISSLILGAINTQSEYVIAAPYCNAFQPPPPSGESAAMNGQDDTVHPVYEPTRVFECKYELDSLAHFLKMGTEFHKNTNSKAFLTPRWYKAIDTVLEVLDQQAKPTFNSTTGTETLSLSGLGNPLGPGTGLIRSAFRPSDDATILGFFIPANAMMAVELKRTAEIMKAAGKEELAANLQKRGESIEKGIWEYGVINHKKYGEVFAFEVDGYGSSIIMDDANLPSLLALPMMGFLERNNKVYQNTRRMILERAGNPYYIEGRGFSGIGGPHIGLLHAWPMSRLVQAMTSDNDDEIMKAINDVRDTCKLGLVHEGVNVWRNADYTRSWFAWANSVFAQTILDAAARKPHLLFGKDAEPFVIE